MAKHITLHVSQEVSRYCGTVADPTAQCVYCDNTCWVQRQRSGKHTYPTHSRAGSPNEDEMRGANTGVFFAVVEVFHVYWKCDTDRGSFVALDGGVYKGEAISDRYSKFGWKERGQLSELGFGRRLCVVSRGFVSIEVPYRRIPPVIQRIESARWLLLFLGWDGLIFNPQGPRAPPPPSNRPMLYAFVQRSFLLPQKKILRYPATFIDDFIVIWC